MNGTLSRLTVFFVVLFLHAYLLNHLEKIVFYLLQKRSGQDMSLVLRPNETCASRPHFSVECLGMPSGHTELAAIFLVILHKYRFISAGWLIGLIALMCFYRVETQNHTVLQTLVGVLFGVVYAAAYWATQLSYRSIGVCIAFGAAYMLFIMYLVETKQTHAV